jgi:molecular chaperone DnaK
MENGKPKIFQTDLQKDTLPSCVAFNMRKSILVGDTAIAVNIKERLIALETFKTDKTNSFLEFKRTMGTDILYPCSYMDEEYSSEQLSAQVLLKLKSFITDENFKSIVITVPAMFSKAQNEATIKAGKLAGFEVVELLQEPIAASIAYGLDAKNKNGMWLVFDFGGGTFDAALIKATAGIMEVIDTAGDNKLGGKDLDFAFVDHIIIPYLQENYVIDSILDEPFKKQILREAMKSFAEGAKRELSFNPEAFIQTYPGDIRGTDDEGNEFELNITITQKDIDNVFAPVYQKAIDITKDLLKRNHITGSKLECLILVGGPTYSPIVQKMLKDQITDNVIANNQMTSVAIGAALYASTQDAGTIGPPPPPETVLLDLKYDAMVVGQDALVNIKLATENTSSVEKVYAVLERNDKAFITPKKLISERASLIEVQLLPGESNYFNIILTDDKGNKLSSQPNNFTIIEGITAPAAPLPYHIGVEVWDKKRELTVFTPLKGLEKNQTMKGAVGVSKTLKTPHLLTAGKVSDKLTIPIYEGDYAADGTPSFYNNKVVELEITGESIPRTLPPGSDLVITLTLNSNGSGNCSVFFPFLNHTEDIEVVIKNEPMVDTDWLERELKGALNKAEKLSESFENNSVIEKAISEIEQLISEYPNEMGDEAGKMKILNNLRKIRLTLDKYETDAKWPASEQELKDSFYRAEELVEMIKSQNLGGNINMSLVETHISEFRTKIEKIIHDKNVDLAKELTDDIDSLNRQLISALVPGIREKKFIEYVDGNFTEITWTNSTRARQLINLAIQNINAGGNLEQLENYCSQISDLVDRTVKQPPIPQA